MSRAQQALFPCVLLAVLAVVWLTGLISGTGIAEASNTADNTTPAAAGTPASNSNISAENQAQAVPAGCTLSTKFPNSILQWCSLIESQASHFNLDPGLVAAVMLQESGGNPSAYSASGAVGLMQVMPSDGLAADFMCSGNPCFGSRPTISELKDPEFNVTYGVRMLAGLFQKYGNLRDALKAYGPANYGYKYADIVLQIFQSYG